MLTKEQLLCEYQTLRRNIPKGDFHDYGFLEVHQARFLFFLERLQRSLRPDRNCNVLDVGSCHLHLSILMSRLGYEVKGVDVPMFAKRPLIMQRAAEFGIENRSYGLSPAGKPVEIPYESDSFDAVVCAETLEHMTFNPVRFWSEIYRVVQNGALMFITTPNAMSLFNMLASLKRLLLRHSIGIRVPAILQEISFGHHWKEYSLDEIKKYFTSISPDFICVANEYYAYRDFSASKPLYRLVYALQEKVLPEQFRSELFVIFRVEKKVGIQREDPDRAVM